MSQRTLHALASTAMALVAVAFLVRAAEYASDGAPTSDVLICCVVSGVLGLKLATMGSR